MLLAEVWAAIQAGGVPFVFLALGWWLWWALSNEKLVMGVVHKRERARADKFEKLSLDLLRVMAKATEAITKQPTPESADD